MKLAITESLLILTHKKDKGGYKQLGNGIQHAILMGVFLDLFNNELLILKEDKVHLNSSQTSSSVLPELFEKIRKSKKPRNIKYWFQRMNIYSNKLFWRLNELLEADRKIRIDHKKFLGFIPYRRTFLINPTEQIDLLRKLKQDLKSYGEISNTNHNILQVLNTCNMHSIFIQDSSERKEIKKRFKALKDRTPIESNLSKTVKETQAALNAAIIAAVITVPTATR